MSDKYLYSPWRLDYILSEKPDDCILCCCIRNSSPRENLIVHTGDKAFIMLNRYPYNNGHIMLVPCRHVSSLNDLDSVELAEISRLMQVSEAVLKEVYHCEGINVGINLGRAAGAGIDSHLHVHMVPRWTGDSNFMSVVSGERVIPEDFELTWDKLSSAFFKALSNRE